MRISDTNLDEPLERIDELMEIAEIAELFTVPAETVYPWLRAEDSGASRLLELLERLVEAVETIAEELSGR
jgi:hypothetical protein